MEVYMELEKEVKIEDKDTAKKTKNVNEKEEINIGKIKIDEPEVKITFKRILMYFIIYSFLGFVVETIFGMLTKGVIESRKSCFYGPFCCIYGLGAAIMIPGLQKFKRNNWTLAIGGMIEGSIIEYVVSWIGEIIFQIKWWDYSNMPLNMNGRICLLFTIFWGILAVVLLRLVNPFIERTIDRLPKKWFDIIAIVGSVFLLLDLLFTSFGLKIFYTRLTKEHNLNLKGENILTVKQEVLDNEFIKWLSDNVFTDEKVLKTFPNIKFEDANGEIIWVKDILTDIQPYYIKISDKITLK
jgi:uncharacterized membrane protein